VHPDSLRYVQQFQFGKHTKSVFFLAASFYAREKEMEVDEYAHVSFKDSAWIQTFGLNVATALDYFSTSQFYDRTCNNEVLKMQTKFNNLEEMNMELSRMVGIEYVVAHMQEPILYIIRKQRRVDLHTVIPIESYYILDGSIFKAPSLYDCLSTRIANCSQHLQNMLSSARSHVKFSPNEGYKWKVTDKSSWPYVEESTAVSRSIDPAFVWAKFQETLEKIEAER
jgi:mediator of RNA polymerase II transcription subunit 6